LQFPPPLVGQVGRRDDQRPLDQPPVLEFLERQPGHDRLAGTGVVGDQEADLRLGEQVRVDRVHLVRQGIDLRDRDGEVRVVLVGQPYAVGFGGQAEMRGVAGQPRQLAGRSNLYRAVEVFGLQQLFPEAPGVQSLGLNFDLRPPDLHRQYLDRLGPVRPFQGGPVRKLLQDVVDAHAALVEPVPRPE
jgi:hypothetical protein